MPGGTHLAFAVQLQQIACSFLFGQSGAAGVHMASIVTDSASKGERARHGAPDAKSKTRPLDMIDP